MPGSVAKSFTAHMCGILITLLIPVELVSGLFVSLNLNRDIREFLLAFRIVDAFL